MKKEKLEKKDNIVKFPSKRSNLEREIEAIIFAAAEPLDLETIENKVSSKGNVKKNVGKITRRVLLERNKSSLYIKKMVI